jgi:hypothetical protein
MRISVRSFCCRYSALLALLLAVAVPLVEAGEPTVTDNAVVVTPKTCQLETWAQSMHDGHEYWAQPACNFTGNLEFSVGAARVHPDTGESASVSQFQAKTVLLQRGEGAWSLGGSMAAARDTASPHGRSAFQTYFAKALASWYPRDDLEVDLNLGGANVYGSGTFALAGAAIQYEIIETLQLLAETYRDEPGRAKYQVGVRYIVVPDRFEAYVSYGDRFGAPSGRWLAIFGIRVQTPAVLP